MLVLLDLRGDFVDLVGNILGGRSTVGSVELDTEIVVRSTWVVRGSEEDTTVGLVGSDQGRNGWGGEDSVLANNDVLDTVTGSETEDDLGSFWRLGMSSVSGKGRGNRGRDGLGEGSATHEESTITTDDDSFALGSTWHGGEGGLDKVLGVVLLLEHLDLLSKTRGTWLLARVDLCLDCFDFVGPASYQLGEAGLWLLYSHDGCLRERIERGR